LPVNFEAYFYPNDLVKKWFKKIIVVLFILLCLSAPALWYANNAVSKAAIGKTYDLKEEVKPTRVGLLLGTSKLLKNGRYNLYFKYRIKAATDLIKSGKIQYLVISGDNGNSEYDEPTDMKLELIKMELTQPNSIWIMPVSGRLTAWCV